MTPNEMVNAYPEIVSIFTGVTLLIGVIVVALALCLVLWDDMSEKK